MSLSFSPTSRGVLRSGPNVLRRATRTAVTFVIALALAPAPLRAQGPANREPDSAQDDTPLRFEMPTVTVTAQKIEEDKQKVPVSVTAVAKDTLEGADVHIVSDAAILAPNTYFTEWSARKLSNARFRGISSSPNNPGITTYIDGVPQLNANSSSIELLDVEQIEFVRGPQSALFGRNTLGGLVNVTSARPSASRWTGALSAPFGNYGAWGVRGGVSGPIATNMSLGVSFAQLDRNGFTVNDVTGNDIDSRNGFSTKAQWMWNPSRTWETRVIFTGERARDGDYALNDVGALRANPFHAQRDFEGTVDRDILGTTVLARHTGSSFTLSSTTGFLHWRTQDVTDLDYTPQPIVTRDNTEKDFQFTQEVRLASPEAKPIVLSPAVGLRWQAGVFVFTQNYNQDAINNYAPFLFAPFPVSQHTPVSSLDDVGLGVFGQGTFTFNDRFDATVGARVDYEDKSANIQTFYSPAIIPGTLVDTSKTFADVSPQGSLAYRMKTDKMLYATVGRGYKAGGFNSASPAGSEAYDEETTLLVEAGAKTMWDKGRFSANAAYFHLDWDDLQLNVPNPAVPAQFYISNVGKAVSQGVEVELGARIAPRVDVFGAVGYTHARFSEGSSSGTNDIGGNKLPNTPDYTTSAGLQYSHPFGATTLHLRGDAVFYGSFEYTDANTLGQDAYSLVNFRIAAEHRLLTGEIVLRNAFDTRYIPLAFPYPGFAPSGFMGEPGAPRTVVATVGVRF
ncbi:MAG TPA: TonB-dependent receptor [Vicinamibacterales bacterium]